MNIDSINPTRLARLFNGLNSVVMVARASDFVLVDVNVSFEKLFDVTREHALGKKPSELGLWQDDQQRRSIAHQLHELGGVVGTTVVSFHLPDKRFGNALLSAERFEFAGSAFFLVFLQRIMFFGEASAALERPLDSYASFFQDADIGFFRMWPGREGLIETNSKTAEILGYDSIEHFVQSSRVKPMTHYVDDKDFYSMRECLFRDGKQPQRRVKVRRLDGHEIWVLESLRAVRDRDGKVLFIEGHISDQSELDVANAQLERLEAQHRLILDNAPIGIYFSLENRIEIVNPALCRLLGYEQEEIIGEHFLKFVAPEDQETMLARTNERERGSYVSSEFEVKVIRKDGSTRLLEVRGDPIAIDQRMGITGSIRDVTEERQSAQRIAHAETRYRNLFENAVLGLFLIDAKGALIEANRSTLTMFGFEHSMQLSAYFDQFADALVDKQERDRFNTAVRDRVSLSPFEARIFHRHGHEFWGAISLRVADGQDGIAFEGSLQDVSARRLAELQLKFQANHDNLTRMPNRQRFETLLSEYMDAARRAEPSIQQAHWVLLLDLDGFKVVNDSLGHAAGDELLMMISDRMLKELPEGLLISRYGGDEFAVVTRDKISEGQAISIAESVLGAFSRPFLVRGHQIFATASLGIARLDAMYKEPSHVMRDADTAMYRAKAAGKNRYEVFDAEMHRAAQERLQIETDLRFGVERSEFITYYQPIVNLQTGRVVGAEALTRWKHPTRGVLPPSVFITLAEESGLLISIDLGMIDDACKQLARWQKEFGDAAPKTISVNISDRLFISSGFAGSLADMIRSSGIDPGALQLEVTETVFRGNFETTLQILRELKSIGVRLLVDDFGTGYSSLVSFTHAAFDGLKIDRGFVIDIETNERNRALVKTICQFARDLNLNVISEGVESFRQTEILLELGCTLGQGFRYAPALPADAFAARLQTINQRDPHSTI
jgi:diguanylate cyclase (GGDEF)-like protein/PAS domain S-box-containing protein